MKRVMSRTVYTILPFSSSLPNRGIEQCISCGEFAREDKDIDHNDRCEFTNNKPTTRYRSNVLLTHLEATKSQIYDHIAVMNILPMNRKKREAAQEELDKAITVFNEAIRILQSS